MSLRRFIACRLNAFGAAISAGEALSDQEPSPVCIFRAAFVLMGGYGLGNGLAAATASLVLFAPTGSNVRSSLIRSFAGGAGGGGGVLPSSSPVSVRPARRDQNEVRFVLRDVLRSGVRDCVEFRRLRKRNCT